MKPERVLAILYEMAIVIGGEIRLQPLLTKTLQRLLFHTSFPCGMVFCDATEVLSLNYHMEFADVRLDMSIGDFELAKRNSTVMRMPSVLLRGNAELSEQPALLADLPCRKDYYRVFLRLPIGDCGVIILLSPGMPQTDLQLTRIFQPVLRNLSKSIVLCKSSEAYAQGLITNRRIAEAALQSLSYRNRLILDSLGEGICGLDRNGNATFVNPAAATMLGFGPEELVGRRLHEVVHHQKEDGSAVLIEECPVTRTISEGIPCRISEDSFRRRDGSSFPVEYVSTPLREHGRVVGAVVVFQDITERKRMEESLHEQKRFAESLIENSAVATFVLDPLHRVIRWNKACEELTGFKVSTVINTCRQWMPFYDHERPTLADIVIDGAFDRLDALYDRHGKSPLIENGLQAEVWYTNLNGRDRFILVEAVPIYSSKGELVVVVETLYDLTENKQAENDLRKLNRALKTLSACNITLIRATEETLLMQSICKSIVDLGEFAMVWVGYAEQDERKTIRPAAWSGREEGYLGVEPLTWDETCTSPAAMAIRSGEPFIIQNIAALSDPAFWRTEALKRRFAACIALPLRFNDHIIGALNIYAREPDAFTKDELGLLTELAGDLSFGIMTLRIRTERDRVVQEHQVYLEKLRKGMESTVQAFASLMEMRDPYISGHQQRVASLAVAISMELGLAPERIDGIHFGSLIHDIGKIYVPAEFLNRPGRLTDLELSVIKIHCQAGYDIVKDIEFPWPVAQMIHQHHEHMDGSGYPKGLKGDEIIFEARILAVADVVEAMASHRPYRPAKGIDTALEEIVENRGILYDSEVVDACLRLFRGKEFSFS